MKYNEDTLAQQTMADYLRDELGWDVVFAYNEEDYGPHSLLGRKDQREVVLTRPLETKLRQFNPGLPDAAYQAAIRAIVETSAAQSLLATNQEKDTLLRDGVRVTFRNAKGQRVRQRLRILNFDAPENNHFLAVRELWVRGDLYHRRPDIIGFVNGLPLLFVELKNVSVSIRAAYEKNLADYRDTVPHLFHHNAIILLANGIDARIGSLSSRYEHFAQWKRLAEAEPGVVEMETLLKGICDKRNLLDLFENFIVFDDSAGAPVKILARNHQFLGVNRAIQAVRQRQEREGKLGVFWHTQGAGKSYSMVFFTRKVHRKLGGDFTFLVVTDRNDLDTQIYQTFAGCGLVDHDKEPCRVTKGDDLPPMLGQHKRHLFALIQKFHQDVDPDRPYSDRDDIIVISDEAHRTQYGRLALNMRNALPHAGRIGFTGTPLFKDDEITRRVFGDYVSTYDFARAVDDEATVPLYYDARGDKLGIATNDLNERIAEKLEEFESDDIDVTERLEKELRRDYHLITADKRLDQIAADFCQHYATAWESGKAMFLCIDKITCVRMHDKILTRWQDHIRRLEKELKKTSDDQESVYLQRQLNWMRETQMAVVISEEQGEVDKFRRWGLEIQPHRRLLKQGFEMADGTCLDVDQAFKKREHPFRVAIVCAMWLTGFDVPSLATLYLDKPLKAHTLMQAIARANRVDEGKNNGLIVDYCGIIKNLRQALATFAGHQGEDLIDGAEPEPQVDPTRPAEELLAELAESIQLLRDFVAERSATAGGAASLDDITTQTGFARNAAILAVKEVANQNDQARKRFEIMAREVFKKFKACLNDRGVNAYRHAYDAINIVYKSLQGDRDKADISDIIRDLHAIVDQAITVKTPPVTEERAPYDISQVDFERLRQEFAKSPAKNAAVQSLKAVIERKLHQMMQQNPLRTDFQQHYENIIDAYNSEKDTVTIEQTFDQLLHFVQNLDTEADRAMREGLDEETLALYDLLHKPDLSKKDIKRIKKVAVELLTTLKAEKLKIDHWRAKEATRDAVKIAIHNFLWSDVTGLPLSYTEQDIAEKTTAVYAHIFRAYPTAHPACYSYAA